MNSDDCIKSTANDALASKKYFLLSHATQLGYFHDPFVRLFTSDSQKRLPLINRGY